MRGRRFPRIPLVSRDNEANFETVLISCVFRARQFPTRNASVASPTGWHEKAAPRSSRQIVAPIGGIYAWNVRSFWLSVETDDGLDDRSPPVDANAEGSEVAASASPHLQCDQFLIYSYSNVLLIDEHQ